MRSEGLVDPQKVLAASFERALRTGGCDLWAAKSLAREAGRAKPVGRDPLASHTYYSYELSTIATIASIAIIVIIAIIASTALAGLPGEGQLGLHARPRPRGHRGAAQALPAQGPELGRIGVQVCRCVGV